MGQENAFLPGALPNMGSPEWLRSIFPSLAPPQPPAGMYGPTGTEQAYPLQSNTQSLTNQPQARGLDWRNLQSMVQGAQPESFPGRFMQNVLGDMVGPVASMEKAMAGQQYDPQDVTAGILLSTPLGARKGNEAVLRSVAGPNSKLADKMALYRAMRMESSGFFDRDTIHNTTGWFKGPDDMWRFEVSDAGSTLKGLPQGAVANSGPLRSSSYSADIIGPDWKSNPTLGDMFEGDILSHYPELAALPIKPMPLAHVFSTKGAYVPAMGKEPAKIYMNSADPQSFQSTLLHELTHAIQDKEGFTFGASPSHFLSADDKALITQTNAARKILDDKLKPLGVRPWEIKSAKTLIDDPELAKYYDPSRAQYYRDKYEAVKKAGLLDEVAAVEKGNESSQALQDRAMGDYKRVSGEIEAQTVQERWKKGIEPGHTPFYNTMQGIEPVENQLIRPPWGGLPMTPELRAALATQGWHGSPHTFPPVEGNPLGRFEDKAIGSGEGAQAYGYGHYVAGNQSVAKGYIPPPQTVVTLKGEPMKASATFMDAASTPEEMAHLVLKNSRAYKSLDDVVGGLVHTENHYRGMGDNDIADNVRKASDWIAANKADLGTTQRPGSLYRVEIRPDEHELLDLDTQIAKQPEMLEKIKQIVRDNPTDLDKGVSNLGFRLKYNDWNDMTGRDVYDALGQHLAAPQPPLAPGNVPGWSNVAGGPVRFDAELSAPQRASQALHEAGIPGSKYLDQGSRIPPDVAGIEARIAKAKDWLSKFDGGPESKFDLSHKDSWQLELELAEKDLAKASAYKPTRNYVIFHPDNLRVLERNPKK